MLLQRAPLLQGAALHRSEPVRRLLEGRRALVPPPREAPDDVVFVEKVAGVRVAGPPQLVDVVDVGLRQFRALARENALQRHGLREPHRVLERVRGGLLVERAVAAAVDVGERVGGVVEAVGVVVALALAEAVVAAVVPVPESAERSLLVLLKYDKKLKYIFYGFFICKGGSRKSPRCQTKMFA